MSAHGSSSLRDSAPRIVRETFERLAPAERTLGARLLATRFLERCADAAEAGDWSETAVWARSACERYGEALPVRQVLAGAIDRVATAFAGDGDGAAALAFERVRAELAGAFAPDSAARRAPGDPALDAIDVALDALLQRLDRNDPLTAEHSRAVSAWCARLGERLGESREGIAHLARSGLIHDVGKVQTPLAILIAPRALTDDEMQTMRRHTLDGEAIVREHALAARFAGVVRSHHERFDGRGYPDGLRGEAIPRDARIVSVADAFNAMIGRRPYRPPLTPFAALEELVHGRSTQFDPDVVDAMIAIVSDHA